MDIRISLRTQPRKNIRMGQDLQKKYGNVPLWVLTNALTFGNISKMYMLLPQDIQIKVSRNYQCVNEKQMVSIRAVLVKFRNVCAHGERLFTYRTADSIPDLPIHRKLKIAQKGSQYVNGKNDLFSGKLEKDNQIQKTIRYA